MINKHVHIRTTKFKSGKESPYAKSQQYKDLNNISQLFTWDYFEQKSNSYNFSNTQLLELSKYRTKTSLFKVALLWNKLPSHFEEVIFFTYFKNKIREWAGRLCTCCYATLNLFPFKKYKYVKN